MKVHILKTTQPYFDEVVSGRKRFEYRHNDRDYNKGDVLVLREYFKSDNYFGSTFVCSVNFMLSSEDGNFNELGSNVILSLSNGLFIPESGFHNLYLQTCTSIYLVGLASNRLKLATIHNDPPLFAQNGEQDRNLILYVDRKSNDWILVQVGEIMKNQNVSKAGIQQVFMIPDSNVKPESDLEPNEDVLSA